MGSLAIFERGFRRIIPRLEDRIPLTPFRCLHFLLPSVLLIYMAYLARRPDTHRLRLMILPIVIISLFGTSYRFMIPGLTSGPDNWALDGFVFVHACKAIDFAWRREGMLKVGEEKPGVLVKSRVHQTNGNAHRVEKPSVWQERLPAWLYDPLELLLESRGIGWRFGTGLHVPEERRPLERSAFLFATLTSVLQDYLILDVCETFLKLIPDVGSPEGGTIFRPELPLPQRYMLSTLATLATGTSVIAGIGMSYDAFTILAVLLFSSEPSSWPPIMDNPWKSQSLHEFWARRWHQLFRETFFVAGGFLGGALVGDFGMLVGTFVGSGIFHEVGAYALGHGVELVGVLFFAAQAPLLVAERAWARVTGHRVKGIYGRAWTYFCAVGLSQPLVDSWHRRGLAGGIIIQPGCSPIRLLLLPLLRWFADSLGFDGLSALLVVGETYI